MKLLVLGASGRCGQWAVRLAVARGHEVTTVTRPQTSYAAPEDARVERGDVTDRQFLEPLLGTHDAVISCLGLRRTGLSPWARLLSPPDLLQRVSTIVAQALGARALRRFAWISAGGVGSSVKQTSGLVRRMIRAGNLRVAYADLEKAEAVFDASPVLSLAVRPVTLVPGSPSGRAGPVSRYGTMSMVRRSDVAMWMLDVVDETSHYSDRHVLLGRAS